jgi:hypothetical protein
VASKKIADHTTSAGQILHGLGGPEPSARSPEPSRASPSPATYGRGRETALYEGTMNQVTKPPIEAITADQVLFITLQMLHELGEVFVLQGALRDRVPNRLCLF